MSNRRSKIRAKASSRVEQVLNRLQPFAPLPWILTLPVAAWFLLFRLNLLQIDHAGHIASAAEWARLGFHRFTDRFFLGYTQNLFYPPFEDVLLGGTSILLRQPVEQIYPWYLVLLLTGWGLALLRISRHLRNAASRVLFLLLTALLFWVDKPELLDFQGLGFIDLTITGLSSQFLGGIFFVLLLDSLTGFADESSESASRSTTGLVACLALTILSHLVMGLLALFVTGVFLFHLRGNPRARRLLAGALTALGLTAFFWVPFVVSRDLLVSSRIFRAGPWAWLPVSLAGVFVSRRTLAAPVLTAGAALIALLVAGPVLESCGYPLPVFHYYRFAMPAILLLVLGVSLFHSVSPSRRSRFLMLALFGTIALCFRPFLPDLRSPAHQASRVDFSGYPRGQGGFGRVWTLEDERGFGFGVDSLLSLGDPDFRSVKGLFSESSYSNTLLTSYLATLLSPPAILDYFYFYGYSCEVQACLMDRFISDYAIHRIAVKEHLGPRTAKYDRRVCYRTIFKRGGTFENRLLESGRFSVNGEKFVVYDVSGKDGNPAPMVEAVRSTELGMVGPGEERLYERLLRSRYDHCAKKSSLEKALVWSAAVPSAGTESGVRPAFKVLDGERGYEIQTGAVHDSLYWLKMNPSPGLVIRDQDGNRVPFQRAFPGIVFQGSGTVRVVYETPRIFRLSGWTSLLVLFAWVFFTVRASARAALRSRRHPQ